MVQMGWEHSVEETVEVRWSVDLFAASSRFNTASSSWKPIMSIRGLLLVVPVTNFSCLWNAAFML